MDALKQRGTIVDDARPWCVMSLPPKQVIDRQHPPRLELEVVGVRRRTGGCGMTHDEIDALPAGREMDALVAEKVMAMDIVRDVECMYEHGFRDPDIGIRGTVIPAEGNYDRDTYDPVPAYSTDIAAAWEVVEKMHGRWGHFTIVLVENPHGTTNRGRPCDWEVVPVFELTHYDEGGFFKPAKRLPTGLRDDELDDPIGWADTAPLAICRAALKAVAA